MGKMAANGSRQTKDRAWLEREIDATEFRCVLRTNVTDRFGTATGTSQ
jgi:hypothetical protein